MCKNVLMFGWEYPPKHCGGLGVACQGIVRGLLHHGAQVTLVLPHADAECDDGMILKYPTEKHIRAIQTSSLIQAYDTPATYRQHLQHFSESSTKDIELYGRNLGDAVHAFEEISVELSKDTNPEVVHSHDWLTFGAGARAAAYHNVPLVAQVHATELDRTHFQPNEWIYKKERNGLLHADHIITVSNYTKNMLIDYYGIPRNKINVVHNGTHDQPSPHIISTVHKTHPMVLFVGRLTVQKGPFHFLEAAKIVHKINPNIQFVVAGEGYLLPELVDRTCEMGLQDNVIFAGKVNQQEVRDLYDKADCFVMPSTSEPFGLVALEAIAHQTPVIVSKQSGASEVIPHAFHVDFWDVDKLADCIATILREDSLALQLKSEAPHTLQNLRWENQAKKIISVYDKARERF